MKRFICILMLAALCTSLYGCNSTGRVHDKGYLRAASIGSGSLTLSFFSEDRVITAKGSSLNEALANAEVKLGKRIVTGYTELVLTGDEENCDTLCCLLNEWKVPPSCLIVCCGEDGGDILAETDTETLADSVRCARSQGKVPESNIITVLTEMLKKGSADTAQLSYDGRLSVGSLGCAE